MPINVITFHHSVQVLITFAINDIKQHIGFMTTRIFRSWCLVLIQAADKPYGPAVSLCIRDQWCNDFISDAILIIILLHLIILYWCEVIWFLFTSKPLLFYYFINFSDSLLIFSPSQVKKIKISRKSITLLSSLNESSSGFRNFLDVVFIWWTHWKYVPVFCNQQMNNLILHIEMVDLRQPSDSRLIKTHCGLVAPYGDIDLGQHWLR